MIQTIDSLADAINDFSGGVILVSHDFRLISQVAEEIWVCDNQVNLIISDLFIKFSAFFILHSHTLLVRLLFQTIKKWEGDILSYKQTLIDSFTKGN